MAVCVLAVAQQSRRANRCAPVRTRETIQACTSSSNSSPESLEASHRPACAAIHRQCNPSKPQDMPHLTSHIANPRHNKEEPHIPSDARRPPVENAARLEAPAQAHALRARAARGATSGEASLGASIRAPRPSMARATSVSSMGVSGARASVARRGVSLSELGSEGGLDEDWRRSAAAQRALRKFRGGTELMYPGAGSGRGGTSRQCGLRRDP
jgi:hypothetical protein